MFELWLLSGPEGRLKGFAFEAGMAGWMTLHRRHVLAAAKSENEADLTTLRERFLSREAGIGFHEEAWARKLAKEVGEYGGSAEVRSVADGMSQTTSSAPPVSAPSAEPKKAQERPPSDIRVSQLARRYGISSTEALSRLAAIGIVETTASSRVTADEVRRFRSAHGEPPARRPPQPDVGSIDGPSAGRSRPSTTPPPERTADDAGGTHPRAEVFVCFAEEHTTVAEELSAALDQQGISTWLYYRDVRPGRNYQVEAARAIKASRAMVVLFSRETQQSRHCQSEVAIAYQARLPIYPVRLDDTDLDEMEYALVLAQWKRGLSEVTRAIVADIRRGATPTGS